MIKFRSQKGIAGIDIGISIVVIFIFINLIAILVANYNSKSKEIELKSEAMYIAIAEIEKIKNEGFESYSGMNKNTVIDKDGLTLKEPHAIDGKEGFYKTLSVEDYADINTTTGIQKNLVKRVTVDISYKFKGETKSIKLSTILSKEN